MMILMMHDHHLTLDRLETTKQLNLYVSILSNTVKVMPVSKRCAS